MTQDNLELFHAEIHGVVQLWASKLITDVEFAKAMAEMPRPAVAALDGLLDPNSGLRYPLK